MCVRPTCSEPVLGQDTGRYGEEACPWQPGGWVGGGSSWVMGPPLPGDPGDLWGHSAVTCAIETQELPLFETMISGTGGITKFTAATET